MCVCVQETGGEGGELWQGRPTRAWARGSAGPQSLSELEAGECTVPNGDRGTSGPFMVDALPSWT